jgi:uncharacterized NAD(P)/FAD-binding protein YdhS
MRTEVSENPAFFTIAIVGGGFSGAILADQLLRQGNRTIRVLLIERDGCPGRGVAYGTHCVEHLLNVRVQNMSARVSDPLHFLRWAQEHYSSQVQPNDYLPRRVYGKYVESTLCETIEENPGQFEWRRDEVLSIARAEDSAELVLRSGSRVLADRVVLALGNFPPGDLKFHGRSEHCRRYVANPWATNAFDEIATQGSVLLVGSGLTSVDVAISLRARGFTGKIHMLSRHGLLPQVHRPTPPAAACWDHSVTGNVRNILRLIRAEVTKAKSQNGDWRAAIDSIRPYAQSIWQSLPIQERGRFLRHLRSFWDVSRHRVAPQIGRFLETEMAEGRLEVHAGRVTRYEEEIDTAKVSYHRRKDGQLRTLFTDYVVNCTGPDADCRRVNSPLLKDLLNQELVRPDDLFLGLDTAENGALLNTRGVASDFLYALGPLRKGNLWESTAVPEIRVQAHELAAQLLSQLQPPYIENSISEHALA